VRLVLVGAGSLSARTAKTLVQRGHEVVVVERDPAVIEALGDELDCALLHGDGTRPAVLREADPEGSDALLCLTGNDQTNLIASLVGRSLGFSRVFTRIDEAEFEHIAVELGLEDTVVPARTFGRALADAVEGKDVLELSSAIKGDARLFQLVVREEDEGPASALKLPSHARITHLYREGELLIPSDDEPLRRGDEVVVVTHRKHLEELRGRWTG
jgi:trk system potassium uptake protein TrkA